MSEQRIEYVFLFQVKVIQAILSILFQIVYHWGNIIKNPKEKHNIHVQK